MANDADLRVGWEDGQLRTGAEASIAAVQASVARMESLFTGLAQKMQTSMESTAVAANQMAAATEAGAGKLPGVLGGIQARLEGISTSITKQMEPVMSIFSRLNVVMAGVGAVLAGGKAFGAAIDDTKKLAGEALHLSQRLGMTAAAAAVLNVALGDVHSNADDYIATFDHFAKKLKENEDEMNAMGLVTRDSSGHLRNANDVFRESFDVLGKYKAGLDQSEAAQVMYGKSVDEAMKFQKLTPQVMDEAAQKAKALGLVLTNEGAASVKDYRAAMNDVGDAMSGIENVIGQALMPVLSKLAQWFSDSAPTAILVLKYALGSLSAAFLALQNGIQIVWEIFRATLMHIATPFMAIVDAITHAISGDWSGAKSALTNIPKVWDQSWDTAFKNIAKSSQETHDKIKNLFADGTPMAQAAGKSGTQNYTKFDKDKKAPAEKSRMGGWEAELAEQKLAIEEQARADGTFHEMSKAEELKYWEAIKAIQGKSAEEDIAVRRKVAEVSLAIRKDQFETQLAGLKKEEAETGKNAEARIGIAEREAALVAQKYGKESKEYEAAQIHMVEVTRAAAEQKRQIADLIAQAHTRQAAAEIDAAQADAQLQVQLGLITQAQLLQQEAGFENQKTALMRQALIERKALIDPDRDPVAYAQINAQIEELEAAHQARQGQIKRQATLEQNRDMLGMFHSMEGGFANVIKGVLSGTMSATKAVQGMVAAVANAVVGMLAQMAAKWLVTKLMTVAAGKATGLAEITDQAAVAGAGGVASMAGAPWPLNMTAPAFGAAMAAMAGSYSALLSAAGGFDIPAGLNPITQLHQSEMVLPAHIADPLRQSLAGGGGLGGDTHLHVHAVDAASVERLFRDNGHLLARELRRQVRNFAPSKS